MSLRSLLVHRAEVLRLATTNVDGAATYDWDSLGVVPCRVDLSFIRSGKDPVWTPEAGRPADRTGVAFFAAGADVLPGDRIFMVAGGVEGTFELQGTLDFVQDRRGRTHHLECGVIEVAKPLGRS